MHCPILLLLLHATCKQCWQVVIVIERPCSYACSYCSRNFIVFFAVAKYCDDRVCVSVCLSVCPRRYLRNHTRGLYQIFCACCLWLWLGPPPAGRRSPKRKGQFWRFFFSFDNALYSIAFGNTQNGWIDRHAVWNNNWAWFRWTVCYVGWRSSRGKEQFWRNMCPTSLTPLIIANWTGVNHVLWCLYSCCDWPRCCAASF